MAQHVHLTFEIRHYIQEALVNLWLVSELTLDRVEVAERIGYIQWGAAVVVDALLVDDMTVLVGEAAVLGRVRMRAVDFGDGYAAAEGGCVVFVLVGRGAARGRRGQVGDVLAGGDNRCFGGAADGVVETLELLC
jgi:hypothetical protein